MNDDAAALNGNRYMCGGFDVSAGPTACWPWTRGRHKAGYGCVSGRWYAHRLAYEIARGPIPTGLHVLHRCDNPPCCNPAHLFLGTAADNSADKVAKGRQSRGEARAAVMRERAARGDRHGWALHPERCPRGEHNGHAKLTVASVVEIRQFARRGAVLADLAKRYGVATATVRDAVRCKTWKHITEE